MREVFQESLYWLNAAEMLTIKSFTAQRIVILLNEFPVFQCFIFVRSPIKLIHNLDAYAIHC